MQNAGTAFPVNPGGHFGGGTDALAAAPALGDGPAAVLAGGAGTTGALVDDDEADADPAGDPLLPSLSQATKFAERSANARATCFMGPEHTRPPERDAAARAPWRTGMRTIPGAGIRFLSGIERGVNVHRTKCRCYYREMYLDLLDSPGGRW